MTELCWWERSQPKVTCRRISDNPVKAYVERQAAGLTLPHLEAGVPNLLLKDAV